MSNQKGHDLITSLVICLIILGIGLSFAKRSGLFDEIKRAWHEIRKSN